MKLPRNPANLDEIDEKYHGLYELQDNGTYLLDPAVSGSEATPSSGGGTDASEYKRKIDEFRSNNINLRKELEDREKKLADLEKKFSGVDLERIARAEEALKQVEDENERKMIAEGRMDEVLAMRTGTMKENYERQLQAKDKALQERVDELDRIRDKLQEVTIDRTAQSAIDELGVRIAPGAQEDFLRRARATWEIDEHGDPQPMTPKGGKAFGSDGDVLTMAEWASSLLETASHLFDGGGGGGASGGDRGEATPGTTLVDNDPLAIGENLEDIAAGKAKVQ